MSKASEEALAGLHLIVAEGLSERLQGEDAKAADFTAAIAFLKNNGITADLASSKALKNLLDDTDNASGPFDETNVQSIFRSDRK